MSFNIRYGIANDGEHHWRNQKEYVAKRIQAFATDLLGLQESRDDEPEGKLYPSDHYPVLAILEWILSK